MQRFNPSNDAIKLITTFEKCELTSKEVGPNLYSVGYKHTGAFIDKKITKTVAIELLKNDINSYGINVFNVIKQNKLAINQAQFDALVDIFFDLGNKNAIFRVVSSDTIDNAADVILTLDGDKDRRKADYNLFVNGKLTSKEKKATKEDKVEETSVEEKPAKKEVKKDIEKKTSSKTTTTKKSSIVDKIKDTVANKPATKRTTKKKVEE